MSLKQTPLVIEELDESIYAGFWIRIGAALLDLLIVLPFAILTVYLNSLSAYSYYYTVIPNILFFFWYQIYLVKSKGGTPGKLLTGIKVIKIDGKDAGWEEAIMREIVTIIIMLFGIFMTITALSNADIAYYESQPWYMKSQYLMTLAPALFTLYTWAYNGWILSEFVVLLFNKRRRAIHDFIGRTAVVKAAYIETLRETMAEEDEEREDE